MKLSRALKEKKRLAAEIAHLKNKVASKNSFLKDSGVDQKFPVQDLLVELNKKIEQLITLKFIINEANREIQTAIYTLSEHKQMLAFLSGLNTSEGEVAARYTEHIQTLDVQIDEIEKDKMVAELQKKADHLQDMIDEYNHTTEIPWNEVMPQEDEPEA